MHDWSYKMFKKLLWIEFNLKKHQIPTVKPKNTWVIGLKDLKMMYDKYWLNTI